MSKYKILAILLSIFIFVSTLSATDINGDADNDGITNINEGFCEGATVDWSTGTTTMTRSTFAVSTATDYIAQQTPAGLALPSSPFATPSAFINGFDTAGGRALLTHTLDTPVKLYVDGSGEIKVTLYYYDNIAESSDLTLYDNNRDFPVTLNTNDGTKTVSHTLSDEEIIKLTAGEWIPITLTSTGFTANSVIELNSFTNEIEANSLGGGVDDFDSNGSEVYALAIDKFKGCLVHRDTDSDGTPDYEDTDSDNDGITDAASSGMDAVKEDIAGNDDKTSATAAQINVIVDVSGAITGTYYATALENGTYAERDNPTAEEIQSVITSHNETLPSTIADMKLWLDAYDSLADGTIPNHGTLLNTWKDKSGNNNDATIASGHNEATFKNDSANQINGKPVVQFDRISDSNGSGYEVTGLDLRAVSSPNITVFTVYKVDTNIDISGVWGIDNGDWDRFFLTRINNVAGTDAIDDGVVGLGPISQGAKVEDAGQVDILRLFTVVYEGNSSSDGTEATSGPTDGSAVYFDGNIIQTFTDTTHATSPQTNFKIGFDGNNNFFDGDIAELIVFDRKLSSEEIRKVNDYLGTKYGKDFIAPTVTLNGSTNVTLTQYESYIELNATVSDNLDENINNGTTPVVIAGDAVDTDVAGVYTVTYSITDSAGLTTTVERVVTVLDIRTAVIEDIAGNGDNIPATSAQINAIVGVDRAVNGRDYSVALADGTYVDPDDPTAVEIQAVVDSVNVLAEIGADDNSNVSDVTISELESIIGLNDVNSSNQATYRAYIADSANIFDTPATLAQVQAMVTVVNNLQNRVTPGGLTDSNIKLWLKADGNITTSGGDSMYVANWFDDSSRGFGDITTDTRGAPGVLLNQYNFNPTVNFDGDEFFRLGDQGILIDNNDNAGEVFMVLKSASHTEVSGFPIQFGGANELTFQYDYSNGMLYDGFGTTTRVNWDPRDYNNQSFDTTQSNIYNVISASSHWTAKFNGATSFTRASNTIKFATSNGNHTYVGASDSAVFHGNISEVIFFNKELSDDERLKVNSYLAIKYGITLDSNLSGYINSAGATVYDIAGAGAYVENIVGIGRDDDSGLNQEISKSRNSGAILTISTDNNFTGANGSHNNLNYNKSYVIFAKNNGNLTLQTTEVNSTYSLRVGAEWKVKSNYSGNFNLKFDGFNSEFVLLKDADGDFSSGASEAGTLDDNGEISIYPTSNYYFTLAKTNDQRPGLERIIYDATGNSIPSSEAEFDTLITNYAIDSKKCQEDIVDNINGTNGNIVASCNGDKDYFLAVLKGKIKIDTTGDYTFQISVDDAAQAIIDGNIVVQKLTQNGDITGSHVTLTAGYHTIEYRFYEHTGGEDYNLEWKQPGESAFTLVPSTHLFYVPIDESAVALAQIGSQADDAGVKSNITVAQLDAITPALTNINASNVNAYNDYIDANAGSFASPATQAEVQAMIDTVNTTVEANNVLVVDSTPITVATVDSNYSYILDGSGASDINLTWQVKNGTTLPTWLDINSSLSTISSYTIAPTITVSSSSDIENYIVDISENFGNGDTLEWDATVATNLNITGSYDSAKGSLRFTGTASAQNWQTLLRTVKITLADATRAERRVSFTKGNLYSLMVDGVRHYYELVTQDSVTWDSAKSLASSKSFMGREGYLTTITSDRENSFIISKINKSTWIGASDIETPDTWKWVTGPEVGVEFWSGLENGSPVNGKYNNWKSGEPNDYNGVGENVAHLYSHGVWNDFPNSSTSVDAYIVEYGGMPNDNTSEVITQDFSVSNVVWTLEGIPSNSDIGINDVNLTITNGEGRETNHNFQINVENIILTQIGSQSDDTNVESNVTVAQLNAITPELSNVNASNIDAYNDYIDANADSFSSPATQTEVQAMITAVNASAEILAQIGTQADDGSIDSNVTVAQLGAIIPALTNVDATKIDAYNDYIDANPNSFSSPATKDEVQVMIDAVNASTEILTQIGSQADDGSVDSNVTVAQLGAITPALTNVDATKINAYNDYIDANPNRFSSPATQTEVQAMITVVNTPPASAPNRVPTITNLSDIINIDDTQSINPFNTVVLGDANNDNLSIELSLDSNETGSLSLYKIERNDITMVEESLKAIEFTPYENIAPVGDNNITTITLKISDGKDTITKTLDINSTSINIIPIINTRVEDIKFEVDITKSFDVEISDSDSDNLNLEIESDNQAVEIVADYNNPIVDANYKVNKFNFTLKSTEEVNTTIIIILNDGDKTTTKEFSVEIFKTVEPTPIEPTPEEPVVEEEPVEPTPEEPVVEDKPVEPTHEEPVVEESDENITKEDNSTILIDNNETNQTIEEPVEEEPVKDELIVIEPPVIDDNNGILIPYQEGEKDRNSSIIPHESLDFDIEEDENIVTAKFSMGESTVIFALNKNDASLVITIKDDTTGEERVFDFKLKGSQTTIDEDGTIYIDAQTDVNSTIKTTIRENGGVEHSVEYNCSRTRATSELSAEIELDENGNISTIARFLQDEFIFKAVVTTDKKGRTKTKFIKINQKTGEEIDLANTLRGDMIFEIGSEIRIFELNGHIYIKIKTPLNDDLVIE